MTSNPTAFHGNPEAQLILRTVAGLRILIVADGFLNFGTSALGLSEFVGILSSAGHVVSTAHRNGTGTTTIGGAFNFATAAIPVTTTHYDELWLFAYSTTDLAPAEQTTIAHFMQSGGGVFATGDHATIGRGMGANIPRVRCMRDWATVPMVDPTRLDTLADPGADGITQADDQADHLPQKILPMFFSNGGRPRNHGTWDVHPVLRHSSGAVDVLPDHPHEGECLAPPPNADRFAGVEEWPTPLAGGSRISAEIIAVSVSGGRFIVNVLYPPVQPRCFGAISVYDGHSASVGRIVCDATWHHFINVNLNGTGASPDTTGAARTGLYVGGTRSPGFLKVIQYYLNAVRWLAPLERRLDLAWVTPAVIRFDHEVAELQLPLAEPISWDQRMGAGAVIENAVARRWGRGTLAESVDDILRTTDAAQELSRIVKAHGRPGDAEGGGESLVPVDSLRRALFVSVVNLLARDLPEDETALARVLEGLSAQQVRLLLNEAVLLAQRAIVTYLHSALETTTETIAGLLEADR